MADTDIEWADKVWNFLVGCTRVSDGCNSCYAIREVARERCAQHVGLTKVRTKDAARPGPDWNGKVRFVDHKLEEPLHWRDPKRIFVNSVSDLFHSQVPWDVIDRAFAIMMASPQHTFLVLTKRDMRPWFEGAEDRVRAAAEKLAADKKWCHAHEDAPWPLQNVHLGVSAEHQAAADLRLPWLRDCPAAVRWMSYEPALDEIDLQRNFPAERMLRWHRPMIDILDWIVIGGESGPGAREFLIDWARSILRQCRAARASRGAPVPVFVKQLGRFPRQPASDVEPGGLGTWTLELQSRKGNVMSEWPVDLRVRQFPTTRTA